MSENKEEQIIDLHLRFNTVISVPKKAVAMGSERYAKFALRNVEATVRVSVPKWALDSGDIKVPKERKGILGSFEILMNASLPDETLAFELTREDYARLDLLKVEFDRDSVPGMVLVKIELPLPAAIVEKQINASRKYMGTDCSQSAGCVVVNNVAGVKPPHQGTGRGRYRGKNVGNSQPLNHELNTINGYWFDYWVNRPEDPEEAAPGTVVKYTDTYFWPAECKLCVQVSDEMLADPKDLVMEERGQLTHKHTALMGAHANLLRTIADGYFRIYMVPEIVPFVVGKGQRNFFTHKFPELVAALDNNKVSAMLQGSGHFQPRDEVAYDFYCCNGANDPNSGSVFMTSACFGRTQPIYHMQWKDGRRQPVIRDGEKVLNNQVGHLVILSDLTAHQLEGAVFEAMVDGTMDRFYEKHGLLFPDEAFAGDDFVAAQSHKKANREAKQGDGNGVRESSKKSVKPDPEPEPEPEPKPVQFGSFDDVLPPLPEESEPEESEDDPGEESDGEDEQENEKTQDDDTGDEPSDFPV
ncbi:MAG: hypothetical protein P1P90_01630 [Patescibacteria group bacterium]|nr:hypothetical protein [Patescibacteria group bacterium]